MTVIPFPDRRPWRLRCLIFELCVELEELRRTAAADWSSVDQQRSPRCLYLVSAPDD